MSQFKLYYNTATDQLGITQDGWDYLVSARFVPFVTLCPEGWPEGGDPREVQWAEYQIAEEMTPEWDYVGDFF